jgi:hypothetical protein
MTNTITSTPVRKAARPRVLTPFGEAISAAFIAGALVILSVLI